MMLPKPKIIIYVILLAVTISLMVMLSHCGKSNNTTFVASGGDTIDVAIEYSPLSCFMYADTLGGFNYDLLRMLARKGGVTIKFHPIVTLQKSLDDLNLGKYKIIVAQFPVTTEYKKSYLFTDPIFLDRQVLVQRKDSLGHVKIKSQLDLAGDTLYIVKGSPIEARINNLSREIGDTIHIATEDLYGSEQLFIMVKTGEINYAVINEKVARDMAKEYPQISIDTDVSFTQFQSWALKLNEAPLRDSINSWLKQVKPTPQYQSLYRRYFK
ncbi:MAG: transporter substrate-binding domain-containing protein [Muribaculaceae bacterium]